MSGYPYRPPPHAYGPPQPYSSPPPQPYSSSSPPQQPYNPSSYGAQHQQQPYNPSSYGAQHQQQQPYYSPPNTSKPQASAPPYQGPSSTTTSGYPPSAPHGNPFTALLPSQFPQGTDPTVIACFQMADRDGSGFIDDKELQMALSSCNESFSLRTVRLLMYNFTKTNARMIGPKEFTSLFYDLQYWRTIFERYDRDRSCRIDANELREALLSLGLAVSPSVLDMLVSKFDKSGGRSRAIEYDGFIECCLTVKGLTDKFKEKDARYTGSATFTYEEFMLTVLPFLIA